MHLLLFIQEDEHEMVWYDIPCVAGVSVLILYNCVLVASALNTSFNNVWLI